MPTLPRPELLAIVRLALQTARGDDEVAPSERQLLRSLLERVRPTEAERAYLGGSPDDWRQVADSLGSPEARVLLVKVLCAVSRSDGVLHYAEARLINEINEHLGRPMELPRWEQWMDFENEIAAWIARL